MSDRIMIYIAIAALVAGMIAGMVGYSFTSGALMLMSGYHFGAVSRTPDAASKGET